MNKQKGISLIALVITIIILLILAGISIASLMGDNGILGKADKAKDEHLIEQYKEEINLIILEEITERKTEIKEELMIVSLDRKIRQKEWVNEIYKCNSNGEEQATFEESTHLLVESKEHYEFLIEVNEAKETAKIVSFQKGTGEKYRVIYHPNGGEGQEEIVEIRKGFSLRLKECNYTKKGNIFREWNTKADGSGTKYEEGIRVNFQEDITLYAIWKLDLPSTGDTTPYLPEGATIDEEHSTLEDGFVIKDSNNNEWVWIEVPKSIYMNTDYNGGKAPTSSEDYAKIESVMQSYASNYRQSGWTDTFYSTEQHGFVNSTEYNNWKNSMLKSVYENGGFYIGRYEVGTETARSSTTTSMIKPLIQRDKYPYNFVTCRQAQTLAKQLTTGGKTTSLMFGIQWDLIMKYIEVKEKKTQAELKTNSTSWGNYSNATFMINRGKYSVNPGNINSWIVSSNYTKPTSGVLLTTGASDRNKVLEIYDLAGGIWEWTLEKANNSTYACVFRGGSYLGTGNVLPVFPRNLGSTSYFLGDIGFRLALW